MQHRQLHHLPHLLDLLLAAADVRVGDVRLLLHRHHRHARVDLRRQGHLDLVFRSVDADAHPLLDVGRGDLVAESDDELRILFLVEVAGKRESSTNEMEIERGGGRGKKKKGTSRKLSLSRSPLSRSSETKKLTLAICLTLIRYLASSVLGAMILVQRATY